MLFAQLDAARLFTGPLDGVEKAHGAYLVRRAREQATKGDVRCGNVKPPGHSQPLRPIRHTNRQRERLHLAKLPPVEVERVALLLSSCLVAAHRGSQGHEEAVYRL